MSIYIGKTPISSVRTSVAATTSNGPISLSINSDAVQNFIRFQNFRLGQYRDVTGTQFQLYHSNIVLLNYNSNQLLHIPNTIFHQNIAIHSNLTVASNVNVQQISSCNLVLQMAYGTPLRIEDQNGQTIYQIGLDETMYVSSNLGIGIFPTTALEVLGNMYVQSNITIDSTLNTSKLFTNTIYGNDQVPSRIDFNQANIHLIANDTIINNPSLRGLITYDAIIQLAETTINDLETSNLNVINNLPNLPALYIKQLNPTSFANTATGNPLHIESYFSSTNTSVPIFIVDTLGRISSGKTSASLPEPDYGYSYHIDPSRYPYLSGFLQLTSCNVPQMIIDKKGYISIGSNQTNHPLQIVHNPSSSKPTIQSLMGLYQTTSNQYSYIQSYDSNNVVQFHITDSGKVLFQQDPSFNNDYLLEVQKRAYIRTIEASNIQASSFIDFMNSSLSNIEHVDTNYLYANSGLMSNVFMYNLTVDGLEIDAFDYVSKEPNYEEFRIIPDRFLFYGSNIVINPNPYFFETEQPDLPNDNVRIYANGGPTKSINVIKTIGNNQLSKVRIVNCNDAVNSISRTTLNANGEGFAFGVINLSTTPNGEAEAFITNNTDLTVRNRQLSIHPSAIRIGENVHLTKDTSKLTIGFTTPGQRILTVIGETEVKKTAGTTSMFINQFGNVGFGTNNPRDGFEIQAQTTYLSGNLGIGTTLPEYTVDVIGTVRANRILGALLDDVVGGSFSNVTPWTYTSTSNIYYIGGNVGIGTQNPISRLHLHSCNLETRPMIEVQGYYTGSWPPVPKASTRIVTSNVLATETSNVIAPFMPIYPTYYLTANVTNLTNYLYGNGIYTAKSSSTESGYSSYLAFDNTVGTYWVSDSATTYRYNSTSGAYEGDTILGGISGEWIQLFAPNTFILRQYLIGGPARIAGPDSSYDIVSPRNWTLLASNTSSGSWNTLHTVTDGYEGTSSYTKTYHLDQDTAYNVYAIVITKANASTRTYGQVATSFLRFFEGSNQRLVPVTYPTYQLVGNTSNNMTLTKDDTYYNTGTYEVSMTSNYTQQPYLDLRYTFNTSSFPYTVTSTSTESYIQQSSLEGLFNDQITTTFTTLSNAFINSQDVNPPLSLLFTYPETITPILQYSITGPTNTSNAPSKWTVSASSDKISWTLLDSQSSITWTPNETKTYTFTSPSTYSYYRYDFYRNNTITYGPLSIQRILSYGTFHTDTSLMRYTTYPAIIPSYQAPPTSNLSQWNISGGFVVGSNYAIQNQNPTNQSILVENAIGIGTYNPTTRLHIEGTMRVIGNTSNEGILYVGTTVGANTGSGIHFGRTLYDTTHDDTVIESYVRSGSYPTELLIFKGSNVDSDRIRLRAGEIRFDVSSNDSLDRLTENTKMIVKPNGLVQLSVPLVTSNLSTPYLPSSNTGIAVFKQYTYFSSGNYTLPSAPEYGCSYARIQMWGAGGGGAGGNMQGTINSAGTILGGAGGGGAGGYGEVILPYELLFNTTLTATIGAGGAGGTAGSIGTTITTTTTSTNATAGTAGTATTLTLTTNASSSFSYTWTANGGGGGNTSTTTSAGNLGAGGYPVSTTTFNTSQKGGDGGLGGTTSTGGGNGGALTGNGYAATGGGGGAGQPNTNTTTALYYSGGNSGSGAKIASYLIGSSAFAYGVKYTTSGTLVRAGESGYSITNTYTGGTGGGGSYGLTGNVGSGNVGGGGSGFAGGSPGGGGGGGASGKTIVPNTSTVVNGSGGSGGAGADGGLILTYY